MLISLWRSLLVLILLPFLKGDLTSIHLSKYLDHSVSPCSDFHAHVCGDHMNANQTVRHLSEQYYRLWATKHNSRNRNNPIMDDISNARKNKSCDFNAVAYKWKLKQRCGALTGCYIDEFKYFLNIYIKSVKEVGYSIAYFAKYINRKPNTARIANVTSNMIEVMIRNRGEYYNFEQLFSPYEGLHDRMAIIAALKSANRTRKFGLQNIREFQKILKVTIANRLKATKWLSESDAVGVDLLSQFLIILEEMRLFIDFDDEDAKISVWRGINRAITSKYFEYSKRTTGCDQFDVIHPFVALNDDLTKIGQQGENWQAIVRMGFRYNAFYETHSNSVAVLAPSFYPLIMQNASDTTKFAFAAILAHELYHPFIKSDISRNSEVFTREHECVTNHYAESCNVWDPSPDDCRSGKQTFTEDGPDVEALRAAYELMKSSYSEEQLKEYAYEDLGITREQAFFYAFGVRYCSGKVLPTEDKHSNDTVRLNAVVSMMPEFTEAFGCQPGEAEYSGENSVCYLFGPRSGFEREHQEEEQVDENGDGVEEGNEEENDDVLTEDKEEPVELELNGSGDGVEAETDQDDGDGNGEKSQEESNSKRDIADREFEGSGVESIKFESEEELLS